MNSIRKILEEELSARLLPLKDVPFGCCSSTFPVYNFDDVKEVFCKKNDIKTFFKSADCLHIDEAKKILCFIEMKNASAHIGRNWPSTLTEDIVELAQQEPVDVVKAFDDWLKELRSDLRGKIAESIFIITAVLGMYGSNIDEIKELLNKASVKIKYFVLFHMTDEDLVTFNLASLEGNKSLCYGSLEGEQGYAKSFVADEFDTYRAEFL